MMSGMSTPFLNVEEVHSEWREKVKHSPTSRRLVRRFFGRGTPSKTKKEPATSRSPRGDEALPPVPSLYVSKRGAKRGAEAWARTLKWRRAHGVDSVLGEAQTSCGKIKRLYPHYLHGTTPSGDVLFFELLGRLDTSVEVDKATLVRHFAFVHEYLSASRLGEETRLVSVLDAAGLTWSSVNSRFYGLVSAASECTENLVPFRTRRVYVINAPPWFGTVFASLQRVLPQSVRETVRVVPERDRASTLAGLCGADLPSDYGGAGPPLGAHDAEQVFAAVVEASLLRGGAP